MLDAFQFVITMKLHRSRELHSAEQVILSSYITYSFAPATEVVITGLLAVERTTSLQHTDR